MLPQTATTIRRSVYTSLLVWKYPTFQLEVVVSVDLRDAILLIELCRVRERVLIQKLYKTGKVTEYFRKLNALSLSLYIYIYIYIYIR
jgi:hypothetical protein